MKKLFVTVLTSAILSGGLFAQVAQDTTNMEGDSIMIRDQAQQPGDQTEDAMERTSDDMRNDADALQDSTKEAGEGAGNSIQEGAEKTGDAIEEGAEKTGDAIQEGAEKTGDAIEEGADKAGDAMQEGADKDAGEGAGTSASAEQASFGPMVEVIADKEGPNHEVVYKVNGEMFYVDREQQQIVKAEESNLRDAKDPAIIHEGGSSETEK
jgi:hypothetical protein